jgi:hypothetical protein
MTSAAFEPTIRAIERFQTYGLDRIASEVGDYYVFIITIMYSLFMCIMYLVHATGGGGF